MTDEVIERLCEGQTGLKRTALQLPHGPPSLAKMSVLLKLIQSFNLQPHFHGGKVCYLF